MGVYFIQGIGYDALIECLFLIITLAVAITAYKVYDITKEKSAKLLALSFFLLSLAYGTVALGNITLFLQQTFLVKPSFFLIIHYSYLSAKTLGLLTLACIPLKIYDTKIYSILVALVLVTTYAAIENHSLYQIVILIFYAVIVAAYINAYRVKRNRNTLLIALGFCSLAIGAVSFAIIRSGFLFYLLGHFFEFIGYCLILIALLLAYVFAHEKRKTPNHS